MTSALLLLLFSVVVVVAVLPGPPPSLLKLRSKWTTAKPPQGNQWAVMIFSNIDVPPDFMASEFVTTEGQCKTNYLLGTRPTTLADLQKLYFLCTPTSGMYYVHIAVSLM